MKSWKIYHSFPYEKWPVVSGQWPVKTKVCLGLTPSPPAQVVPFLPAANRRGERAGVRGGQTFHALRVGHWPMRNFSPFSLFPFSPPR
jgi:hypothetical protein